MKKINFNAGPCILPEEVFKKASQSIIEYEKSGLSILEISHRSKEFTAIMEKTKFFIKRLLQLTNEHEILFLQGGASLQFHMIPANFLSKNGKACYLDTGTWSSKAITESKKIGETIILATSDKNNYKSIPKKYIIPNNIDYFHCTSNNTIYGTQIKNFPKVSTKLFCDMSSDIFSRKINTSNFDLIYAGAQKNIGPAGMTLVILKKSILENKNKNLGTMLDYNTHIQKESMFNTPPVFSIYVSMLNLKLLYENGGISWIENINNQKADLLYEEIDRNSIFSGIAEKEDRSNMNITFSIANDQLGEKFDNLCLKNNIQGIKGHRSVGGYRASLYNAMSVENVRILTSIMQEIEKNG
tara:strand:+ start:259 stop:1326 length:1068 start_codon:yes stop_codon:yes gene_type:complete